MTARIQLPWDKPKVAAAAISAGWRIDNDLWWTRPHRPHDPEIPDSEAGFGFMDPRYGVYVRSAAMALGYDKGRTKRIPTDVDPEWQ